MEEITQIYLELKNKLILKCGYQYYEYKEFNIDYSLMSSSDFIKYIKLREQMSSQNNDDNDDQDILYIKNFISDKNINIYTKSQKIGVIYEPLMSNMEVEVVKRIDFIIQNQINVNSLQRQKRVEYPFYQEEEIYNTLYSCLKSLKSYHQAGIHIGNIDLENIVVNQNNCVKIADCFYQTNSASIVKENEQLLYNCSQQLEDIYQLGICFQQISSLGFGGVFQQCYSPKLQVMIKIMLSQNPEERVDIYDFFDFQKQQLVTEKEQQLQQEVENLHEDLFHNGENLSNIQDVQDTSNHSTIYTPLIQEKYQKKQYQQLQQQSQSQLNSQSRLTQFQIYESQLSQMNQTQISNFNNEFPVFKIEDIVRESFDTASMQLLQNCSHRSTKIESYTEQQQQKNYDGENNNTVQDSYQKKQYDSDRSSDKFQQQYQFLKDKSGFTCSSSSGKKDFSIYKDQSDEIKEHIIDMNNEQKKISSSGKPQALTNILNSIRQQPDQKVQQSRFKCYESIAKENIVGEEQLQRKNNIVKLSPGKENAENISPVIQKGKLSKRKENLELKFQQQMNKSKLLIQKCEQQKKSKNALYEKDQNICSNQELQENLSNNKVQKII